MTYISISSPEGYKQHYEDNYVGRHFTLEGMKVTFKEDTFNHAFYEKDKDQKRVVFSKRRACRMDEIGEVLSGNLTYVLHRDSRYRKTVIVYISRSDLAIVLKLNKKDAVFTSLFPIRKNEYKKRVTRGDWIIDESCLSAQQLSESQNS